MAPRPLLDHVALTLRVPRGQDGWWAIITDLAAGGATWTLADIDARSNVDPDTISEYLRRLIRGGWVEVVGSQRVGSVTRRSYRLVRNSREAPRLRRDGTAFPETARDRMWRAMKMLDTWTPADLAAATETEASPSIPILTVKTYVWRLDAAGILQKVDPGKPGTQATYRLLRNVGAAAPRILRTHLVFDPNSNTVLGTAEAEEVA